MQLTSRILYDHLAGQSQESREKLFKELYQFLDSTGHKRLSEIMNLVPIFYDSQQVDPVFDRLSSFLNLSLRVEELAIRPEGKKIFDRLFDTLTVEGQQFVRQAMSESLASAKRRMKRIDGFLHAESGQYKMVEVNQSAPYGLFTHDKGQEIATMLLDALGFKYRPTLLIPHLLQWFVDSYQEQNPRQLPRRIALVVEHGYPPKFTDLPMAGGVCSKLSKETYGQEIEFVSCFPYDISLKNSKIYAGELEVDMIWRNSVYMTEYRKNNLSLADYDHICANPDKFCIVNSTRCWLTRTKELFALLLDPEFQSALNMTSSEIEMVQAVVPGTYSVLGPLPVKEIKSSKNQWLLKPTDSSLGEGICFGENYSQSEWEQKVDEFSRPGIVFQKMVSFPKVPIVHVSRDYKLIEKNVDIDHNPYYVNGGFHHNVLVRAQFFPDEKQKKILNISAGSLVVPALFSKFQVFDT